MPEAICCCLQTCNVLESKVMVANTCTCILSQTSTYSCFCRGGEIYNYYVEKLSFPKLLYFLCYMNTCIAIIMYCQRLFLLFTCKQHCLHKKIFGGPTCDEYLSSCKISSSVVLRFWQYSSSTRLRRRRRRRRQRT